MTAAQARKQLAVLEAQAEPLREILREAKGRKYATCTKCLKRAQIRTLVYIQTHWYEGPYGCTGGDNWHQGEGQYDCPKCGHRNRLYDRPELQKLKYDFKSVEDVHGR